MITQSAVTIVADIVPGREAEVQAMLANAGEDPANNDLIPFKSFETVHFARFFIVDAATDPTNSEAYPSRLIFLADVDGPAEAFLMEFVGALGDGLHTIYQHCREYAGRASLSAYLEAHRVKEAAKYVNTIGRTVVQVRQEAQLHDAIQSFLDRTRPTGGARQVRAAIQEFVEREPSLRWALQPVPLPDKTYLLGVGERVHFALVAAAGIVLFPAILLGAPFYLALLRWHETTDQAKDVWPDDARIQKLAAQEDHGVQNPYIAAGFVKPGPFRRVTGSVVLWGTNFLARHIFNNADLIGVKTIHFARWVFLDKKRRLVFASNYDGSLENYMDDFIDKIAWALNIVFSNGTDYPRTNWLVLDGARDEEVFKRFNLMHQLVSPFWYAAYQGLTALNIQNNAQIRAGLYGAMDEARTRDWLRKL